MKLLLTSSVRPLIAVGIYGTGILFSGLWLAAMPQGWYEGKALALAIAVVAIASATICVSSVWRVVRNVVECLLSGKPVKREVIVTFVVSTVGILLIATSTAQRLDLGLAYYIEATVRQH